MDLKKIIFNFILLSSMLCKNVKVVRITPDLTVGILHGGMVTSYFEHFFMVTINFQAWKYGDSQNGCHHTSIPLKSRHHSSIEAVAIVPYPICHHMAMDLVTITIVTPSAEEHQELKVTIS